MPVRVPGMLAEAMRCLSWHVTAVLRGVMQCLSWHVCPGMFNGCPGRGDAMPVLACLFGIHAAIRVIPYRTRAERGSTPATRGD